MDKKNLNIAYFNKVADRWDNMILHSPQKILYFTKLLYLNKGDRVLDVGTGTGILIPYLLRSVRKEGYIDAIDISPKMIEIAKKRHIFPNVNFIVGDIETFEFGDSRYNCIACYSVFPHIDRWKETLKRLYDILIEGGRLGIFHSSSRDTINNIHKDNGFHLEKHLLPPAEELARVLQGIGFSIEHIIDNKDMYLVIGKR